MLIGVLLVGLALAAVAALVLWSRRAIDRISSNGFSSARKIVKDRRRGR